MIYASYDANKRKWWDTIWYSNNQFNKYIKKITLIKR